MSIYPFELAICAPESIEGEDAASYPFHPCPGGEEDVKISAEEEYAYSYVDDNHYDTEDCTHCGGGSGGLI